MPGSEGGSAQDDAVDPRYDPRFQRGYDPEAHRAPATRGGGRDVPPVLRSAPHAAPRVEPTGGRSGERLAGPPGVEPLQPAGRADDADPTEDDGESRRNPYLIVLPALSVLVLLLAAGILHRNATSGQLGVTTSDSGVLDLLLAQLAYLAPQGLIAGGVVGFALWLALLAVLPRGRAR